MRVAYVPAPHPRRGAISDDTIAILDMGGYSCGRTISPRRLSGVTFSETIFPDRYSHSTTVPPSAHKRNETSHDFGHAGKR
jgi:hypothetical protein